MHELLGTASPPVRRFAIAFAGLGGFVLTGTLFLLLSRDDAPLLLLAIIPGALSAGAVAYATRERRPRRETMLAIVGRSVFAAILCPFVTAGVLLVISLLMGNGPGIVGGGEVAFYLCLGSAIASFFVAPLGAVFGVVYALVWQRLEATRAAGRSAHEQLWILFGMAFATLGIIDLLLSHTTWTPPFGSPPRHDALVPLGVGVLVFGLLTMLRGSVMAARRRRILRAVAHGLVPGYALAPASEIHDAEALPDLFGRNAGKVLVRRMPGHEGPYRATESVEPLARL